MARPLIVLAEFKRAINYYARASARARAKNRFTYILFCAARFPLRVTDVIYSSFDFDFDGRSAGQRYRGKFPKKETLSLAMSKQTRFNIVEVRPIMGQPNGKKFLAA